MSVQYYDKDSGTLTTLASGSRVWTGTKAAYDAEKQAGTLPNNCIIVITDDEVAMDTTPTKDSPVAVTSDGIYNALTSLFNKVGGMHAYYNANTNRSVDANRQTAIDYVLKNIIIPNHYVSFEIRYEGGYYHNYLFFGAETMMVTVLEVTWEGELCIWRYLPANDQWTLQKTIS